MGSQFKDQILQYAGEVLEGKHYWDVLLQTFEFSTILTFRQILGAKAVFSPDDKMLASMESDYRIFALWNT